MAARVASYEGVMPEYDQQTAECLVFTFKDGLLSKMAHDLKLRVTRFSVSVDPGQPSVSARFDPSSLCVEHAMRDGAEAPAALSAADKDKIAEQIQAEVLETPRYAEISFQATRAARRADGGYDVSGKLTLHGTPRELDLKTRLEGDRQVAELTLHQPDFGITPYKAMMGTLKIKPDVRIRISVPAA